MRVLAIETSCDETSAAVVEKNPNHQTVHVRSNITATSMNLHAVTGGIIPERAAREQIKFILPVVIEALLAFKQNPETNEREKFSVARNIFTSDIDAIAVTYGPGLIGSLLVGVETAKTLSYVFDKPIIPVNHLLGHIFANFIGEENTKDDIHFPFVGLIVSGGHTDLLLFRSFTDFTWLGGTRDDAAGEALDKIARIIGLPYPGGPEIEKHAREGNPKALPLKSPMIGSHNFDFSFSGLKTQASREIQKFPELNQTIINDIAASVQNAIIKVLVRKTITAAKQNNISTILLGGGVSANKILREEMEKGAKEKLTSPRVFFSEPKYSTDNAAMVGAWSLLAGEPTSWQNIHTNPELYFG